MADIVSAPQVLDDNEVILYGNYYRIKGPVQVSMSSTLPPKLVVGDYGKDDNALISTYSVSDLRGGMGRWRYRDPQAESDQFWTSQTVGAGTWHSGALTLPPLVTEIGQPASVTAAMDTVIDFNGTIMATFGLDTRSLNSSDAWSASLDTLPGTTVWDVTLFNSRLFYWQGSYGYSYRNATTGAATDVATGAGVPTPVTGVVWDSKIYVLDTSGILYSHATGLTGSNWTTLAGLPWPASTNITQASLVVYDDSEGDPIIHAQTNFGLWAYDAVNDKWFPTRLVFPGVSRYRGGNSGASGYGYAAPYNHDGSLLVISGKGVLKYHTGSVATVESLGTDQRDGTENTQKGWPEILVPDVAYTFMVIQNSNATGIGSKPMILLYNGRGWHPIWQGDSGVSDGDPAIHSMALSYALAAQPRLYFGARNAAGTNTVYAVELVDIATSPTQSSARTYAASGAIELPYFFGNYEAQQKTALKMRVKCANATATETVQIAYRIDGSTGSWTDLGSAITSTTEQTIYFGTNSEGLAFKSIQFRITFARGSTTTTRPIVEYIALDFIRNPETLRGFVITVDCSEEVHNVMPGAQITNLWTAINTNTLGTFSYRDDSGATRDYLVKVLRPSGVEFAGYNETGQYQLFLAQLNAP